MARSLRLTFPAVLLFFLTGLKQGAFVLYEGLGMETPPAVSFLLSIIAFWALSWWLRNDLRKRGETLFYCLGMVLGIAWPIAVPYYLFKTRGLKAFAIIAVFAGIWLTAAILPVIIGVLMS